MEGAESLNGGFPTNVVNTREAMIYLAMSRLMLRRLARQAPDGVPSAQRQGLRGLVRAF